MIKMAKNSIFSSDKEYRSTYYFKPSPVPAYKRWSGNTAHKKIKDLIDKMSDADADKFHDYYEDLGEEYDRSQKYLLYGLVKDIEEGKNIDDAIKDHDLGGKPSGSLRKKPDNDAPIIF